MAKTTVNASDSAQKTHILSLDNRKSLSLSGVESVLAFDEKLVALRTACGDMTISGEGLHVTTLLMEDGRFAVEGRIDAVTYSNRAARAHGAWRSILKA